MPVSVSDRLQDLIEAADDIFRFLGDLDLDAFRSNSLVAAAVERKFISIGEALNALSQRHPDIAARFAALGPIVGFRNILVHRYREVDAEEVFKIARIDLMDLRATALAILAELGPR